MKYNVVHNVPGPIVPCTKCDRATPLIYSYEYHGVVWCRRAQCEEEYKTFRSDGVVL